MAIHNRIGPLFFAMILAAGESSALGGWDLPYLAYGDLRGHLEPCGCDPKSDLGGVKRLHAAISRERLAISNLKIFDLGNAVRFDTPLLSQKSPFIVEAILEVRPDAVLFNRQELMYREDLKEIMNGRQSKLPYVLSNAKSPEILAKDYGVAEHLMMDAFSVYGFVSPEAKDEVELLNCEDFLKRVGESEKRRSGRRLLLFSGTDSDLRRLTTANIFDEIISSSHESFEYIPKGDERQEPGKMLRLAEGQLVVYTVPVGGQGLLRGGKAKTTEVLAVGELVDLRRDCSAPSALLSASDACKRAPFPEIASDETLFTWLDAEHEGGSGLDAVFSRYDALVEQAFAKSRLQRLASLKSTPFAGSESCKSCHAEAYKAWETSSHAHAMATLKAKGKDRDTECVACHVVGGDVEGGFVSMEDSPMLANVQCENCHGPRRDHAKNPGIKPELAVSATEVCTSCHHPPHTVSFDFQKYWDKIKHGK